MPLHRVVKDSSTPGDDLARVVERLEASGAQILQVVEQPGEWLVLTVQREPWSVRAGDRTLP